MYIYLWFVDLIPCIGVQIFSYDFSHYVRNDQAKQMITNNDVINK